MHYVLDSGNQRLSVNREIIQSISQSFIHSFIGVVQVTRLGAKILLVGLQGLAYLLIHLEQGVSSLFAVLL